MTRPNRPDVSDPKLHDALDNVGSHIENYNQNLDLISKDIKSIEQYLSNSGIRHWVSVTFDRWDSFPEDNEPVDADNYSGPLYRKRETIQWAADNGDRWRLMYVKTRQAGHIELMDCIAMVGPSFGGATDVLERKPLIETPAAIRLKAHRKLAELVETVGRLVEYEPMVQPLTDDDIPF